MLAGEMRMSLVLLLSGKRTKPFCRLILELCRMNQNDSAEWEHSIFQKPLRNHFRNFKNPPRTTGYFRNHPPTLLNSFSLKELKNHPWVLQESLQEPQEPPKNLGSWFLHEGREGGDWGNEMGIEETTRN